MNQDMWTEKGIWLKGNTHAHTTNSDGVCSSDDLAMRYERLGYDFVFLTDHNKRTVPENKIRKPLMIPAEEIDFSYRGYGPHFVCLGLKTAWDGKSFRSPMQLLAKARRAGAFVIQAHPYWCGIPSHECVFQNTLTCPGIEVYNNVCNRLNGKGYSNVHWDNLLDKGHRVVGIACDDTHNPSHIGGGWIMLKAKNRSPEAILAAIRKGYFYSSQGPEIRAISVNGREIKITACSPVMRINFISNRMNGCSIFAASRRLKQAVWTLPKGNTYVRIELVSLTGETAWSNPIYFAR